MAQTLTKPTVIAAGLTVPRHVTCTLEKRRYSMRSLDRPICKDCSCERILWHGTFQRVHHVPERQGASAANSCI